MTSQVNIVSRFLSSAEKFPDKTAIAHLNKRVSYSELATAVKNKAAYFKKKGIEKGDRILVFVPMSIDLYASVLGLFYCGAVAVFLDEWVNKKRMELCCQIAQCKGFIASGKIRLLALLSKEIRTIPVWLKSTATISHNNTPACTVSANDTALITFTTGSTGTPKAANRTHAFLDAQFNALVDEIKPHENDIDLPVLPIVLLMNLGVGCTSVISSFKSAKPWKTNFTTVSRLIQREKINRLESSPDFVLKLAKHCIDQKTQLSTLKNIFTGGAPVFPKQAQLVCKAFPLCNNFIVYGSTEAEPVSLIRAEDMLTHTHQQMGIPVGTIYKGTKVVILPIQNTPFVFENTNALLSACLPLSTVGEIVVTGKHVLRTYINNPDAIRATKIMIGDDCWHRTGDSGFLDANGDLFLCGRINMILQHHGSKVYPFLYENALFESGLCTMGTAMRANSTLFLVAEGDEKNSAALAQYMREKNFIFDSLVFLRTIPRDARHHSKIDYAKLELLLNEKIRQRKS